MIRNAGGADIITAAANPILRSRPDQNRPTAIDLALQAATEPGLSLLTIKPLHRGQDIDHVLHTSTEEFHLHSIATGLHHPPENQFHHEAVQIFIISRNRAEAGKAPDGEIRHRQIFLLQALLHPTTGRRSLRQCSRLHPSWTRSVKRGLWPSRLAK